MGKRAEINIDKWNFEHPIGTQVRYWTGLRAGEGKRSRTSTAAFTMPDGTPVAKVEGHAAVIALTHIEATAERKRTERGQADFEMVKELLDVEDGLSSSAVEFAESLSRWLDDNDRLTEAQRRRAREIIEEL